MKLLVFPAFILFTIALYPSICFGQKITLEEVLSNHLNSIGTKEKRAEIKNMVIVSEIKVLGKGGTVVNAGKGVIASAGRNNIWGMALNSNDYAQDSFAFDGKQTNVGYIRPGVRSIIGQFISSNKELLSDGLLGGTLLTSWSLLSNNYNGAKLSYDGMKKVDGNQLHVVEYLVKDGSDLTIKFFFDVKNYRHVRTEYNRFIAARQGNSIDGSAGQTPNRHQLNEEFSDFQTISGLTIPKIYKLSYKYSGSGNGAFQTVQNASREVEWQFNVSTISTNQDLGSTAFDLDSK